MASIKITLFALLFLTIFTYSKAKLGHLKETKITLYFKDYPFGSNATTIQVSVGPPTMPVNFTRFGFMSVMDDPLLQEIKEGSALIARGHGFYAVNSLDGHFGKWLVSVVFINGKYKGSTLELYGYYSLDWVTELVVVGGTGKFRLSRGYAIFKTLSFDPPSGYSLLRCNITVLHY